MGTVYIIDREVLEKKKEIYPLEFDDSVEPKAGGEGAVYFTTDHQYALKIYHPSVAAAKNVDALLDIIRVSPSPKDPVFRLFGWPIGLVLAAPDGGFLGILMPNVMANGWLEELIWYEYWKRFPGVEKSRRGSFRGRVKAGIDIADAIRFLNLSGFAQSDISGRNFLINPVEGRAVLIDLDGLAVPGYLESAVLGTPGYMAPELVMGTYNNKPVRPSIQSDRHALAVVLYGLLLMNHPFLGGKMPALANDPDADVQLRLGEKALYVENRHDTRNAPDPSWLPTTDVLGPELSDLFHRAFVDELYNPAGRPQHSEWKRALENLLSDLTDCHNPDCVFGGFPTKRLSVTVCPFCGTPAIIEVVKGELMIFQSPMRDGGFFNRGGARKVVLPGDGKVVMQQVYGTDDKSDLLHFLPSASSMTVSLVSDSTKWTGFICDLHGHEDPITLVAGQTFTLVPGRQIVLKHRDKGVRVIEYRQP